MQNLNYQHKIIKTERGNRHTVQLELIWFFSVLISKYLFFLQCPLLTGLGCFLFSLTDDIYSRKCAAIGWHNFVSCNAISVSFGKVTTAYFNKLAFLKKKQCEDCIIIIYLMTLYDHDLKCIEGRHITDIFKSSLWVEPNREGFKINEVTFGFFMMLHSIS